MKKEVNNIVQLRMYTVRDELVLKENSKSPEDAKEKLLNYFADEHYGPIYSRGTIRCLDLVLQGWRVAEAANNPRALLLDEETPVEEWKLTLYDMGDNIIISEVFQESISESAVDAIMLNKNAFYGVVSAREMGVQFFTISQIQINKSFNLHVNHTNNKSKQNLALTFAKALAQDKAETERIMKQQHLREKEADT